MTFIAGYIYKNTVAIVADSAVTYTNLQGSRPAGTGETTSFFEGNVDDGETSIREGAQKIYELGRNVIATFAGREAEGDNTMGLLRYELLRGI